jgi:hypothetical protein
MSSTTPGEPFQRQLVDALGRRAADHRVVVVRRVDMGRVVGPQPRERLDRPTLAVTQQLRSDAEHRLDRLGTLGVVGELHVGAQNVGQLRG